MYAYALPLCPGSATGARKLTFTPPVWYGWYHVGTDTSTLVAGGGVGRTRRVPNMATRGAATPPALAKLPP